MPLARLESKSTTSINLADLDSLLTEDEIAIRSAVRAVMESRVKPFITEWFEDGEIPTIRELMKELGNLGVLGMHLEGYGCAGMSAVDYGLACLEIEAVDSGIRSLVSVQGSLAMYAIWHWGSEEQKNRWLPAMARGEVIGCFGLTEPDAGSDPSSMQTRARRDGDDWVITGRKTWISNAPFADVAIVWAKTEADVRGFIVPTHLDGVTTPEIRNKLSLRASKTGEIVLDAVRVPDEALLPVGIGLRAPLSCLNEARFGIVWGSLGAARDCIEIATRYSSERMQFGKTIDSFQMTQAKLVNMHIEYTKGYLLALHLGRKKDQNEISPAQVSIGKLNNTREALNICREARTILGANGISLEYDIIRHQTNLESVLTYEGTSEMHTLILGQEITGKSAFR